MPLAATKGDFIAALETAYNSMTLEDAQAKLDHLYTSPNVLPGLGTGVLANAGLHDYPNENDARVHMNGDWFGKYDGSEGRTTGGTGWWNGWTGDSESIFRQTLIRTIEIAFLLNHNVRGYDGPPGDPPPQPTTPWPVPATRATKRPMQFLWVCGPPMFQGYVTWTAAQVTTLFITPGPNGELAHPKAGPAFLSLALVPLDPSPPPADKKQRLGLMDPTDWRGPNVGYPDVAANVGSTSSGLLTIGHRFTSYTETLLNGPPDGYTQLTYAYSTMGKALKSAPVTAAGGNSDVITISAGKINGGV